MSDFLFAGLNLAITTPFDAQGRIDFQRLERNIERYIAAGVRGFVLSSGTGMHVYLPKEESRSLVERGAKFINGRAKIIAQTSALLAEDVVEQTRHAAGSGADGVMVLPPFFEGPTDDQGIVDFYSEVADGGLPIIGYNVPQAVGVAITPSLLKELCAIPGFCAVKDSSGDLGRQAALIRTGLPVMNGADNLVAYALYAGCSGLIWGGANFAPRTTVALVEAAGARNWDKAREIWRSLEPVMSLLWEGDYVQSVYAAAELTGYGAGIPRKPLRALPSDKVAALRQALGNLIEREAA
ncbi:MULTISPECIES: dihydrodipicolinate synthase family protein [unclassified Mesorhizobium]|uniref:dihydrodipicolinate synthase family protein n=1 Tax=unclassified Mesorhizobium TaxID=325217 RepID=UPI000BAE8BFA|nr:MULTISPECIES: dihydrodipicolinate synthase family protein [unclassified Mesorhizobium]TGT58572.1 dihydrodipicolinate synthase family protein [Mesorhizobium sp. M00.F.Ca.ET.170.01.1.1]AZO12037.1 dihydrodipicolinate synthase family protein [Mesorhizobium sp. M3A.F.Ca.ET.080.04.2.1]PBB84326.1 dihydrodipicolinate synthase family protein [Mesorhizobium sp. WSM3876]RWB74753.1 MAG: dihydrodipicolinate synthase family protein [Mesorhizobium sp.]RWB89788.1 MAG: dihydrodipicolinate synthase family pr